MMTAFRKLFHRGVRAILFRLLGWLKRHGKAADTMEKAFQFWYDLPVGPVHYYSPLPDVAGVMKNQARWRRAGALPGLRMDLESQSAFVRQLQPFAAECSQLPGVAKLTEAGYGLGYGEVEAHFLHCMIRFLKPRQIIEVGSGVSTMFCLNALDMNARESGQPAAAMHCIEPYPSPQFKTLESEKRILLHAREVQDVPADFFERLGENDLLFIDSSHAGKLDSDVYYIYLELLPRLKPGVVVHIHDICFPHLTLPPNHPVFPLSMLWNEGALCQAFLAFNDAFQVLMCQSQLHHQQPSAIAGLLSIYDSERHVPSSLWLKRM